MRFLPPSLLAALLLGLSAPLVGCGSDDSPSPAGSPGPGGSGGQGGAGQGGAAGSAGQAGGQAGKGGSAGSAAGSGGSAAGSGGAGAGGAGSGGSPAGGAGSGGAGQGGLAGQGGAGAAQGGAGQGGSGAGQAGAGQSGSAGGGTKGTCCEATPGVAGCLDASVASCVCAEDDACCSGEWSQGCVEAVALYGCGSCGAGAGGSSGSSGQGGAGQAGAGQAGAGQAGAGQAGAGQGGAGSGGAGQGGASGGSGGASGGSGGAINGVRVRVMAANLTSGNFQNYDLGHGLRIIQGARPDVVLIQEMNYLGNADGDFKKMTSDILGEGGFYYREPAAGAGVIPNGVISRYPILDSGIWDDPSSTNREFAWARIDAPGDRDLWAVSVHLLTKSPEVRNDEAKALVSLVASKVPPSDLLILGGDFNTDVREEPCIATLAAQFVTAGPFPADQNGNDFTNTKRTKPYDWLLANPTLDALKVSTPMASHDFPSGLVIDTRVYSPLSDIAPAQLGDSEATSMQHMGVVRDFALP